MLKEIGKEIYLNIFESIQGVVMNAHKNTTQQALLCVIHSFLSPLWINNPSLHTQLAIRGK